MLMALDLTIGTVSLEVIVWGLFIGIMIGGALAVYNKRFLGAFVRKLVEEEAFSPEKALTLGELGYEKNKLIQRELTKGVAFKAIEINIPVLIPAPQAPQNPQAPPGTCFPLFCISPSADDRSISPPAFL